jgi:Ca-activated chloride channel family protein
LALPLVWFVLWAGFRHVRAIGARYGAECGERPRTPANRATLWSAVLAFGFLAWLDPRYGTEQVQVERRGLDVVFCLDTSRSMLARDLEPSRLLRARRDIVSMLPELVGGDRVGLVAFAGEARLVVPLTHDLDSFRQLLAGVDTDTVRKGGSDLAAALRKALDLVEPGQESTTAIVLLTDGEDLTGAGRQAAAEVAARGVIVHTVGYGSTRGSKITVVDGERETFLQDNSGDEVVSTLDADGLRRLSGATGGEFLRADVMPLPLVELKRKRLDQALQRSYEAGEETLHKTRFQWVLLPAFLLLLIEILAHGGRRT